MLLRSLKLENFRNYKSSKINFESRVNLFLGDNGQGKTNLIEAISYLTLGQPIRYSHKEDLVNKDAAQSPMRIGRPSD